MSRNGNNGNQFNLQITLSPSSIKRFDSCKAGYLYVNFILPRIDPEKVQEITKFGRNFHDLAETNFDKDSMAALSVTESESTMREVSALGEIIKTRYYFQYPAENEEHLIVNVRDKGRAQGYPDRMCNAEPLNKFIIVDYKTTEYPDPWGDRPQLIHYAYIKWKRDHIDPERFELVLDYVRSGQEPFVTHTTERELQEYENYLVSMLMKVRRIMNDFLAHGEIKKIPHTPGNCTFCPMLGRCIAYQMVINPSYDPINPQHVTTIDLIKELMEREYATKINDARAKVLKQALMTRVKEGGFDPDDTEHRPVKEVIEEFYTMITGSTTEFPTQGVLERILPKRLKKAIKEVPFSGMVDAQALEYVVRDLLQEFLPLNLKPSDLPPDDLALVQDLKSVRTKAPYLRQKG